MKFEAIIERFNDKNEYYVKVPIEIKEALGKGSRIAVHVTFDEIVYNGYIMKEKDYYYINVRQNILKQLNKEINDLVYINLELREKEPLNYSNIDEYINQYDGEVKERMIKLRELINSCSSQITEKLSWAMPTFYLNGNLVHFAAGKKHIGFYPGESGISNFTNRFDEYKYSKGAVQFPNDKPFPYDLVKEIVLFRIQEQKKNLI